MFFQLPLISAMCILVTSILGVYASPISLAVNSPRSRNNRTPIRRVIQVGYIPLSASGLEDPIENIPVKISNEGILFFGEVGIELRTSVGTLDAKQIVREPTYSRGQLIPAKPLRDLHLTVNFQSLEKKAEFFNQILKNLPNALQEKADGSEDPVLAYQKAVIRLAQSKAGLKGNLGEWTKVCKERANT